MLLIVWAISCGLLAWIDIKTSTLPNKFVLLGTVATFSTAAVTFSLQGTLDLFAEAALLTLAVALVLLVLAIFAKGAFGMGDVKFAPLCFLLPALNGLVSMLIAAGLAFTIAAIFGLSFAALTRRNLKIKIPMGPFLFLGSALALAF